MSYIKGVVFISEYKIDCSKFTDFMGEGIGWLSEDTYVKWTHTKFHNEIDPNNIRGDRKYFFTMTNNDGIIRTDGFNDIPSNLSFTKSIILQKGTQYLKTTKDSRRAQMNINEFNKLKDKAKRNNMSMEDAYRVNDVDWDFLHTIRNYPQEKVLEAVKKSVNNNLYKEIRDKFAWASIGEWTTKSEKEKILKHLKDSIKDDNIPPSGGVSYYKKDENKVLSLVKQYGFTDYANHNTPNQYGLCYLWVVINGNKELFEKYKQLEKEVNKIKSNDSIKDVKPRADESKTEFIARFMNETKSEYPNEKQRYAVANSYWGNKAKDSIRDGKYGNELEISLENKPNNRGKYELVTKVDGKEFDAREQFDTFDIALNALKETARRNGITLRQSGNKYIGISKISDSIKDDDFDYQYALECKMLRQNVQIASDLVKMTGKSANEILKGLGYSEDNGVYYQKNGKYTRVIQFKDKKNLSYYVLKNGNIPRGWTLTKIDWFGDSMKDSIHDGMESEVRAWWDKVETWNQKDNKYNIDNYGASAREMLGAMFDMLIDLKRENPSLYQEGKKIYNRYSTYSKFNDGRAPTTTRSMFTKSDIDEKGSWLGSTEWGTRKGSLYIYKQGDKIIAEGNPDYDNDFQFKGKKEFNSLYALNQWLNNGQIGDSIHDEDIDQLSEEEKQAIDDYKKAIAGTKDVKLLELYSHILREEIEHLQELEGAKQGEFEDSVKAKDLINRKIKNGATEIRRMCIKHDWYNGGTISDYDRMLTLANKGTTINELAVDIAKHSHGVSPMDVAREIDALINAEPYIEANDSVKDKESASVREAISLLEGQLAKEYGYTLDRNYINFGDGSRSPISTQVYIRLKELGYDKQSMNKSNVVKVPNMNLKQMQDYCENYKCMVTQVSSREYKLEGRDALEVIKELKADGYVKDSVKDDFIPAPMSYEQFKRTPSLTHTTDLIVQNAQKKYGNDKAKILNEIRTNPQSPYQYRGQREALHRYLKRNYDLNLDW